MVWLLVRLVVAAGNSAEFDVLVDSIASSFWVWIWYLIMIFVLGVLVIGLFWSLLLGDFGLIVV